MSRALRLLPHDPAWRIDYEVESKKIRDVLKGLVAGIEHIGSS